MRALAIMVAGTMLLGLACRGPEGAAPRRSEPEGVDVVEVAVRFPEGLPDQERLEAQLAEGLREALNLPGSPQVGGEGCRVLVTLRRFEPDAPPKSTLRRVGEGSAAGTVAGAGAGLMVGGPFVAFTVPIGAGVGLLSGAIEGMLPSDKARLRKALGYLPYRVDLEVRVTGPDGQVRTLLLRHPPPEGPVRWIRTRSWLEPGLRPLPPEERDAPGRVARATVEGLVRVLAERLRQPPGKAGFSPRS